jgi:hypothetical protein
MMLDEIGQNYFTGYRAHSIDEDLLSEDHDYINGPDYGNIPYRDS